MSEAPVFSARDVQPFTPAGTSRTYLIAPLTYREREAFKADLIRQGGEYPSNHQLFQSIRAALRDLAPENLEELLGVVLEAEADPDDPDLRARIGTIEATIATVPAYSALVSRRLLHMGMLPYVAVQHGLRGWSGPDLPELKTERGLVTDDAMNAFIDAVGEAEMKLVGYHAFNGQRVSKAAVGNSAAPSPSSGTPGTGRAGSTRRAGARGSSAAKKSQKTQR